MRNIREQVKVHFLTGNKTCIQLFSSRVIFPVTWRHGGLIVRALISELICAGVNPGPGHCVVLFSWKRHFTLTVPLSTRLYIWVPGNLILWVTLWWSSIPSRGSRNTLSHFWNRNQDKLWLDGPLGSCYAGFTSTLCVKFLIYG